MTRRWATHTLRLACAHEPINGAVRAFVTAALSVQMWRRRDPCLCMIQSMARIKAVDFNFFKRSNR